MEAAHASQSAGTNAAADAEAAERVAHALNLLEKDLEGTPPEQYTRIVDLFACPPELMSLAYKPADEDFISSSMSHYAKEGFLRAPGLLSAGIWRLQREKEEGEADGKETGEIVECVLSDQTASAACYVFLFGQVTRYFEKKSEKKKKKEKEGKEAEDAPPKQKIGLNGLGRKVVIMLDQTTKRIV